MLISHPPLPENGPDDESKFVEDEDDDEEIPSAHSSRDEVEEGDEVEEPARKKRKLPIRGESASASSPAKGVGAAEEVAVATSPGAQSSGGWEEPLNVPPVASAAPRSFARMPSPSLSSFDDASSPRLVSLPRVLRVVLLRVRRFLTVFLILLQPPLWQCRLPPSGYGAYFWPFDWAGDTCGGEAGARGGQRRGLV